MAGGEAAHAPSRRGAAVGVAVVAMGLLAVGANRPGFFDNEARYAEVAREMILRGDFVTPTMDFTLFLNKPPLLYWLTAGAFGIFGETEWARVVSLVAAGLVVVVTARIGAQLWGERTGLVAAVLLATMLGFAQEARVLRPDLWIVLSVVAAIRCWLAADAAPEPVRTRWLAGFWAALGVGMLAKGFVPAVVAGIPVGILTLREHGLRGVRRLRPGLGLVVLALLVLPWHVAVALRHPGFAWDYVVNQHLLFFLDRKFPRDSEGDGLGVFWGLFVARAFPWLVLAPLALGDLRGGPAARGTVLCGVWLAGVMGFFSLAPSRLEHYALPALPAVALLAARGLARLGAGLHGAGAWRALAAVAALLIVAGGVGVVVAPGLLQAQYWIAQAPGLAGLGTPAGAAVALGGAVTLVAALRRRAGGVAAGLALASVLLLVVVRVAEVEAEPLASWRPLAEKLVAVVPPDAEVVFESPEEYQLVGGLVFYAGRRVTLLEYPNFVPPTYLEAEIRGMFLPRDSFLARWTAGQPTVIVSDPQQRRESPGDVVPPPHHVLGRFGDRWLIANVPMGAAS